MGGVWDIYLLMIYSTRTPRCSTSMTHMEMSGVEVKCEGKPHCNTSDSIRSSCRLALRQPVPSSKPLRPPPHWFPCDIWTTQPSPDFGLPQRPTYAALALANIPKNAIIRLDPLQPIAGFRPCAQAFHRSTSAPCTYSLLRHPISHLYIRAHSPCL